MSPGPKHVVEETRPALPAALMLACLGACVTTGPSAEPEAGIHRERAALQAEPGLVPVTLEVPEGETLELVDQLVEADEGRIAILVRGSLIASRLRIVGGTVGLRIEGGSVVLEEVTIEGSRDGVELRGGRLEAKDLSLKEIQGSAVFVGSGILEGENIIAEEVGYGLLGRPDGVVEINGLTVRGASLAAVALVGTKARLDGVTVEGPSRHGAVIANDLGEPLRLFRVSLTRVAPVGVSLLRADAEVDGLTIDGVGSAAMGEEGAGVLAVSSTVRLLGVDIRGCSGEGVAAIGGSLLVEDGVIIGSGQVGVAAWRGARIDLHEVRVLDGEDAGVAATEGSLIVMQGGASIGNRFGAAIADCATGSRVILRAVERGEDALGPCVEATAGDEPPP